MSEVKRCHYLPQFYLRKFADDEGKFWVFDRHRREYRLQTPKNTAVERNFYMIFDDGGTKNQEIEQWLSQLEGAASEAIRKLEREEAITFDDRIVISLFAALMMTRVPDFRKTIDELSQKLSKAVLQLEAQFREANPIVVNKNDKDKVAQTEKVEENRLAVTPSDTGRFAITKTDHLRGMLETANEVGQILASRNWLIVKSASTSAFITSDNPFVILPPPNHHPARGVGVATPGAKSIIPLSSAMSLVVVSPGNQIAFVDADRMKVRSINIATALNSDYFLIARERRLLEYIVKRTKIDEYEVQERVRM